MVTKYRQRWHQNDELIKYYLTAKFGKCSVNCLGISERGGEVFDAPPSQSKEGNQDILIIFFGY